MQESNSIQWVQSTLDNAIRKGMTPGIQYLALDPEKILCRYEAGLADIRRHALMDSATTMMAYSMSKTITAASVLQVIEALEIRLDDSIDKYVRSNLYGRDVTIRHLLSHTSGIPNPIPLRWVHPEAQHATFNEDQALSVVIQKNSRLLFPAGTRFRYSNLGYWLLGKIVEQVSGKTFTSYVTEHILKPLSITAQELAYVIPARDHHAAGYVERYSLMNLFKRWLIDREYDGGYEGRWLRIRSHYLNGAAFGGLVGTPQGFGKFLRDQLQTRSVLFNNTTRELFYAQQRTTEGMPVPMTLGWHVGSINGVRFYYKEGGGAGFHCMMRLYPRSRIATVVMTNATRFDVRKCLNLLDRNFVRKN